MTRKLHLSKELFQILRPKIWMEPPDQFKPSPKVVVPVIPKPGEPLAFCRNCQEEQQLQWKSEKSRGKTVDSWFVCAICGCGDLTIKRIPQSEAIAKNKLNCDNAK